MPQIKSCSELNFLQKTQWAYMSIPRTGARELQKLPFLKYCNVQKRKNRFVLGVSTAKNTDYIKERLHQEML